jgi:hypothetical protein
MEMEKAKPGVLEAHALHLGGLVANLQSLEILIRLYLSALPGARPYGVPRGVDLFAFPLGTLLDESDLTSYETLGDLIDRYNALATADSRPTVDRELVRLRDAVAHGRVSAAPPSDELRLIKFGPPRKGKVRIEFNQIMTTAWLIEQKQRAFRAMEIVYSNMPQGMTVPTSSMEKKD